MMNHYTTRVHNALFGAAFGDALAAPVEFKRVEEILRAYPPHGPVALAGEPARVTDDTQMMLAVGWAMIDAGPRFGHVEQRLRARFVEWFHDPENNRAPGNTCLSACRALEREQVWWHATVKGSKGCGANMRVQPVGLLAASHRDEEVAGLAQLQAAMTHGHPTALAASDLTAMALRFLVDGCAAADLVPRLLEYGQSQRRVYHEAWLGAYWSTTHDQSPELFMERGWQECLDALMRVEDALKSPSPERDPCIQTGDGWIAEEALATGLHAFLLYPDDPLKALNRAAVTRGDSDSIACLAGAFVGAYHEEQCWPESWYTQIEYAPQLASLAKDIAGLEG